MKGSLLNLLMMPGYRYGKGCPLAGASVTGQGQAAASGTPEIRRKRIVAPPANHLL